MQMLEFLDKDNQRHRDEIISRYILAFEEGEYIIGIYPSL